MTVPPHPGDKAPPGLRRAACRKTRPVVADRHGKQAALIGGGGSPAAVKSCFIKVRPSPFAIPHNLFFA